MHRATDWVALSLAKGPNGNALDWPDGKASRPALYSCMRRSRERNRRTSITRDPLGPIRGTALVITPFTECKLNDVAG